MCLGKWELEHLGGVQYVHPTFLYESVVDFFIFFILMKLSKNRKFSGQIVYLYFIIYSFARFFIEGLRTDSLMLGEFRISQILSAGIFIAFTACFMATIAKRRKIGYNKK